VRLVNVTSIVACLWPIGRFWTVGILHPIKHLAIFGFVSAAS
jgi:hypothetical protein